MKRELFDLLKSKFIPTEVYRKYNQYHLYPFEVSHIRNGCNGVKIYQSFWDFLSYLAEYPEMEEFNDYLILNAMPYVEKALPLLEAYEYCDCYLPGNDAGSSAGERLMTHWETLGKEDNSFGFHCPKFYKTDVNEVWMKKQARAAQASA